jgi:magnesium transporter
MLRTLVWEAGATGAGKASRSGNGAPRDAGGIQVASPLPPLAADQGWAPGKAGKGGDAALPPFCREVDDPTEISDLLEAPDHYLWLDLTSPSAEELRLIAEEFSLHPLAVEDAAEHSQRPKIEQYDGFYLMVVFAITAGAEDGTSADAEGHLTGTKVRLHEIDLFIGERYLITVHDEPVPLFESLAGRWRQNRRVLDEGIGVLVYTLLDAVVDAYFPILDGIVDRIEALEETLFTDAENGGRPADPRDVHDLFQVKKDLLQMRRVVAPERDAMLVLTRQEARLFDRRISIYFQDVYDHIVHLTDTIDVYQDLLTNALDSYLAIVSNNLNQVMKTLTALTVILMVPTLIAGVYGMNFEQMPELRWTYGYPLALGMMGLAGAGLFVYFRRKGWI